MASKNLTWSLVGTPAVWQLDGDPATDEYKTQKEFVLRCYGGVRVSTGEIQLQPGEDPQFVIDLMSMTCPEIHFIFTTGPSSVRPKATVSMMAEMMATNADTYNGVVCTAASFNVAGSPDMWACASYSDGSDNDAAVANFIVPENYAAGTDIEVVFTYRIAATTGAFTWGVGVLVVGDGEDTDVAPTYATGTETVPTTAFFRKTVSSTFTGAGFAAGDSIGIVLYRDSSNAADTISDSLQVMEIGFKYEVGE